MHAFWLFVLMPIGGFLQGTPTKQDCLNYQNLGSDQFKVRDQATHALIKAGPRVLSLCRQATDDLEIRHRAGIIANQIALRQMRTLGQMPFIDTFVWDPSKNLYDSWSDLWQLRLKKYLADAGGSDSYPYRQYRVATHLMTMDLLAAGVPAPLLRITYHEIRIREAIWLQRHYPAKDSGPEKILAMPRED